jgi:peptidoglycan/xylan/chitin deacetylase (PgdA/CDA1 family)
MAVVKAKSKIPILCYHKVGPLAEEGRYLNIEPAILSEHVRFLKRRGFRFVQAQDWNSADSRTAILTFDDAYASTLTYGVSALAAEDATASIYAVPSLIGKASVWDGERASPLADASLLKQAQQQGIEIGNHTWSHSELARLGRTQQRDELQQAHEALLEMGILCRTIAYPYGSHDANTVELVRAAGYTVGLALSRRLADDDDDPMALPRIVIGYGDRVPQLIYKLWIRPMLPKKPKPNYVP